SCSDYLARRRPPAAPAAVEKPRAPRAPAAPKPRRRSFKENQELAGIEAAIADAEAKVAGLEALLQDPAVYTTRAAEVPRLGGAPARRRPLRPVAGARGHPGVSRGGW